MIDYNQIHDDLVSLLTTGPSAGYTNTPVRVFMEMMENEDRFDQMPYLNARLVSAEIEPHVINTGAYAFVLYEVDVVAYAFNHFTEAARIRDELVRESQLAIQENTQFSAQVSTCKIGETVRFFAGTPEGQNGHISACTYSIVAEVYIEPA